MALNLHMFNSSILVFIGKISMGKLNKKVNINNGRISLSTKGIKLIDLYEQIAFNGYKTHTGEHKEEAYNDFEAKLYKDTLKLILEENNIKSILDYGCGTGILGILSFKKPAR